MPILRLKLPNQGEITHQITAPRITIGRRPDNTIQVLDRSVSGHHAELIFEDGHYRLHDLGSTNLTLVDGQPVTDFHLHQPCAVTFGSVACEFDPHDGLIESRLSAAQLEKDVGFLRGENAELHGKIVALQRQVDILSSARLVTKKADTTPFAAHNDTLKVIVSERDDLRHLTSGLKMELEKVRQELTATQRERDAARQVGELLQAEKAGVARELQEFRQQAARAAEAGLQSATEATAAAPVMLATPAAPNAPASSPSSHLHPAVATSAVSSEPTAAAPQAAAPQAAATQKISPPIAPACAAVAEVLPQIRRALESLTHEPADTLVLAEVATDVSQLVDAAQPLAGHPILRLARAAEALLGDFALRPDPPAAAHIRTLAQATELISHLLEPRHLERPPAFADPRILAVDDDADLLETLAASLALAHLPTTGCADSRTARALAENDDYDLLLLDVSLPGLDGPTLCGQFRAHGRHRKTPIIFLTAANTIDQRAQASLSGGNDFLPKPFSTAELAVKAETWIWRSRYGLL